MKQYGEFCRYPFLVKAYRDMSTAYGTRRHQIGDDVKIPHILVNAKSEGFSSTVRNRLWLVQNLTYQTFALQSARMKYQYRLRALGIDFYKERYPSQFAVFLDLTSNRVLRPYQSTALQ